MKSNFKMPKKILVVGGTGFIGFHICKYFLKKRWSVSSISLSPPKKIRKLNKIRYFFANISKFNSLKFLNNLDFDFVINCGGYVDHSSKLNNLNNHFNGCKNLYKIFSKKKINKFIQIGSSSEYGLAKSPQKENLKGLAKDNYGKPKLDASNFLKLKKNFPYIILRLYQVYGPNQDMNRLIPFVIRSCLENKLFPCSEGKQYRDFLYIDDLLIAINKCFKKKTKNNQIFNIGYGKPMRLKKIILSICKNIKKGQPEFGKIHLRKNEQMVIYPSIKKVKKILNWEPKTNIKKGISKTIRYYKRIS